MPPASTSWSITRNFGVIQAQLSTSLFSQTISAFPIATDQPPRQTILAVLFIDALENVLFEEVGQVRVVADGM
jgi:hypothetical protein